MYFEPSLNQLRLLGGMARSTMFVFSSLLSMQIGVSLVIDGLSHTTYVCCSEPLYLSMVLPICGDMKKAAIPAMTARAIEIKLVLVFSVIGFGICVFSTISSIYHFFLKLVNMKRTTKKFSIHQWLRKTKSKCVRSS